MEKNEWKNKVQELISVCQDELRKTTSIGKKMLTASKTTSSMHEAYGELGRLVYKAIERGELEFNHARVAELMKCIKACQEDLDIIENEVQRLKFAAGPDVAGIKNRDYDYKSRE